MTFQSTAWAIDGATLNSSLARRAQYAAVGGFQGIVHKNDLRVTQLAVPGVGILIGAGVGVINNDYQSIPNETYVVSNPSTHTIPPIEMPAASPAARSFIVAVVVGDPDFSQTGHPWMGSSDPAPGEEETFQYVRPTLIQVSAGATTLDVNYPALPLARIDIPANTTTIINSYITDLRTLSQPRQSQQAFVSGDKWSNASPRFIPSGTSFQDWGSQEYAPSVKVPSWATRAILIAHINGVAIVDNSVNIKGYIRAQLGSVSGPSTIFDNEVNKGGGTYRDNFMCAGEYDVTSLQGQTVAMRVEGYQDSPASPTNNQKLGLYRGSHMVFDVRFFEE